MTSLSQTVSYNSNKYDYLIIILIISLASGDIASPLLLSRVISVLFLPTLLRYVRKCEYINNLKNFFFFLMGYSIFSLVWTCDFTEGCKGIVYNCVHFALFLEIIVFSRYANNPLKSISTGWMICVFLLSIIAIWEIVTGNHLSLAYEETQSLKIGGVITQRMVANGTFINYNSFVKFLCFALPWIFYRMSIVYKERFNFIITLLTLVLTILTVFINGSRGGLFAIVTVLVIYIFFMPKGKASFIIFILFVGCLIFMLLKFGEQIFLVLSMKSEMQGLASDSSRIEIWTASLKALSCTMGLGSGIGGVSGAIESVSKNIINVPHNMVIEALLEYGLILGLVFIIFIVKLLRKGYILLDKNRRMAVLMSILSMPLYGIINSLYLKSPETFALFSTIFVFVNYERIRLFRK